MTHTDNTVNSVVKNADIESKNENIRSFINTVFKLFFITIHKPIKMHVLMKCGSCIITIIV